MLQTIKKKINGLSQGKKSVLTLVGGTTIAQGLNFLFSPIQTRLFSPEVFGALSVFTSITGILSVIVCFRYELAIVLPKDDDEGFALLKLSFIFAAFVSLFSLVLFGARSEAIYKLFGASSLQTYWYYVPITLLLTGLIQASNYWLTRKRQFKVLSYNKVVPVLVLNVVSISLGFLGNVGLGARLFAVFVSNIANIAILATVIIPEFKSNNIRKLYKKTNIILNYKNFLLYDIWGALINTLSWMIVPILMNMYYGSAAAGQYAIGLRVIQIPASLIGAAITQVFFKNASEKKYEKFLYRYSLNIIKKLLIYTAPIVIFILLFGKPLFRVVFGTRWEVAGVYSQILAPWALLWFCASPIHLLFTITQKQSLYFVFSILNLGTRFLSLYLGKLISSDMWGIAFFSLSGFIVYGISMLLALNEAKKVMV